MDRLRDLNAYLNVVSTAPTAAAAGTVSSTAFKLDRANSGVIRVMTGAATGTPTTISVIARLMVADDDGAGAPGSFAAYTGPDDVAASVTLTAASTSGEIGVHIEGSVSKVWGRLDVVTSFTGGSSPTVASCAVFIFNDLSVPARAIVFAA